MVLDISFSFSLTYFCFGVLFLLLYFPFIPNLFLATLDKNMPGDCSFSNSSVRLSLSKKLSQGWTNSDC